MPKRLFICYNHGRRQWVEDRLMPVLRAAGVEVLIDREQSRADRTVIGQMDQWQDQAELSLLMVDQAALASRCCRHEIGRALAANRAVLVRCDDTPWPPELTAPGLLHVDFRRDNDADAWALLWRTVDADLGSPAPHWLRVRDELREFLGRDQSVNLVYQPGTAWKPLLHHLTGSTELRLRLVDLDDGATASRPGLIAALLGSDQKIPNPPKDLAHLASGLRTLGRSRIAVKNFDRVTDRVKDKYDTNLFAALRHEMTETRSLVLLVVSKTPFARLLPDNNQLSFVTMTTVTLQKD